MMSWMIASHQVAGNFLFSQGCVHCLFCHMCFSAWYAERPASSRAMQQLSNIFEFFDRIGEYLVFFTFIIALCSGVGIYSGSAVGSICVSMFAALHWMGSCGN